MAKIRFYKYHALGNDYLVLDPADCSGADVIHAENIKAICHRNYGLGSDGILWGPYDFDAERGVFSLRIFNSDGSEAEKSGNGLRIFSRYLYDKKLVRAGVPFHVKTLGGTVESTVHKSSEGEEPLVTVQMGRVSFDSAKIPVRLEGAAREVINEKLTVEGREFTYCAATVGNPHCVIPVDQATEELAKKYGPHIETHPLFPNRTNVQFMTVPARGEVRLEIWERGSGYTLASGSSSSAAVAVARKLGLCDERVRVVMPGGELQIFVDSNFDITMTGPVKYVGEYLMQGDVMSQCVS